MTEMRIMKEKERKHGMMLLALAGILWMSSCNEEDGMNLSNSLNIDDIEAEATLDAGFEEVDDLSTASLDQVSFPNGRIAEDDRFRCAEITHDTVTKTIIIDFGDGCPGRGDRIRRGRIIVDYTDRRFVPGSEIVITLEDFYIDSVHLEGIRRITNLSVDLDDNPTFSVVLSGGQATWPDGTFATREVDLTRTWIRASNPLEDEFHLDGVTSGLNRDGVSYSTQILSTLIRKNACLDQRIFIPVQGIKEITRGDRVWVVDFGDGSCDREVTVTTDGAVETVNLEARGRHQRQNG